MSSYLQSTSAECGLACLGFIANYHGQSYSMSELRGRYNISVRGINLLGLVKIANLMGFSSRSVRLDLDELRDLSLPCILHWDLVHFVVLISVGRNSSTIHDPATGIRTVSNSEISGSFTGVAMELTPAATFEEIKPKAPIKWSQLTGSIRGLKGSLIRIFLVGAGIQVASMITPLFTQWIVDGAILSSDLELLTTLIIGAVLLALAKIVMESSRGWLTISLSSQFSLQWAMKLKNHLLRLPSDWFESRHIGEISSRFQSMQTIQQIVSAKFLEIVFDGVFGLFTFAFMVIYSWKLALITSVALASYAVLRIIPHDTYRRRNDEIVTHDAKSQSIFLENIRGIQAIKLSNLEGQRGALWHNSIVASNNKKVSTQLMGLFFTSGYGFIFSIESIGVLAVGANMAIEGVLTVGMLMAYVAYKSDFSGRMQRFIDNIMTVRMMQMHIDRVADIALSSKEKVHGLIPQLIDSDTDLDCTIRLVNLGYRYSEDSPWIFRNLSITIPPGEHICFVGPTGCGKTTLAKLILGLMEPTEGTIYIGEHSLDQLGLANWRRLTAAVMQNDQLLSATIRENVSAFNEVVEVERISNSLRQAEIGDEVARMPMGMNTFVGDMGSSLSGGQKQRLIMARAFYQRPRVLVLDEATSHLDTAVETKISESIKKMDITRITVAHRPETIRSAERVLDFTCLPTA